MRKKYKITKKDYERLFSGDINYLIYSYEIVEYGSPMITSTAPKWKRFLWEHYSHIHLFRKFFDYSDSFQHYRIAVDTTYKKDAPVSVWSLDDFIKEKNLKPGDVVWVGGIYLGDGGKNIYSRAVSKYVILKDGYAKIYKMMGT